jgi:dienelactone hydrolase
MRHPIAWLVAIAWIATVAAAEPLPGTQPLTAEGDLASQMVEGIDRFLLRETAESLARRDKAWKEPQPPEERRKRLARMIGAADARAMSPLWVVGLPGSGGVVWKSQTVIVYSVKWPVLAGLDAEGLLLVPDGQKVVADVIALPDADHTPEQLAGLTLGVSPQSQFALRLAESGCRVLVPALVNRDDAYSVSQAGQATNQPHREWVYRPAFEVGRHVIGYEVQSVLAGVDALRCTPPGGGGVKLGVIGYGEGGLLALHAAALEPRIDAACVSGYFGPRQDLWREPIYRNVFGLLNEFGDAELARLVAPRPLVVEACAAPDVKGPPRVRERRRGAAPGRIETPTLESVRREVERAAPAKVELVASDDGKAFGTDAALTAFLKSLGATFRSVTSARPSLVEAGALSAQSSTRLKRRIEQMGEYTQSLVRESEYTRRKFWEKADAARKARSVEQWAEATKGYRDYFENDVIGKFDTPLLAPNVRTRQVYDEPKYAGYEVVMDVFPDVFAFGILLVPKDIKEGERRPVVVCQHGLEGRPQDVADPKKNNPSYNQFACRLAERGFVTYAPQNPYIFGDRFRTLQRKANPLGKTLFSIIVPQHRQATDWLASLPFVDSQRVAFYGLSYGGKTAMRVPPLVDRYCLSICSADFNEWIWKNTSIRSTYSYVPNMEYEIFEWDLGNTFNYAEMAGLICPRPFMVERGHRDGVAPDETVAYEYAKVRLLYADLKIPDRTRIEFFDGPHTIHGVGTFEFLHEQLNWPAPRQ